MSSHNENESVDIPQGLYDVWLYKVQKRTHRYYFCSSITVMKKTIAISFLTGMIPPSINAASLENNFF